MTDTLEKMATGVADRCFSGMSQCITGNGNWASALCIGRDIIKSALIRTRDENPNALPLDKLPEGWKVSFIGQENGGWKVFLRRAHDLIGKVVIDGFGETPHAAFDAAIEKIKGEGL